MTLPLDWRTALPEDERSTYSGAGYGRSAEPGGPLAVLIVDVTYGFVGHSGASAEENRRHYPNWCGVTASSAVRAIRSMLAAAVEAGVPVVQTVDVSASEQQSVWSRKHARLHVRCVDDAEVVAELACAQARVVEKSAPSAFFGSDLHTELRAFGVTDLVVAGCTTSGCVRATVVDAFSHGFNTFVLADGVFDRASTSHAVNLFEMDQKYATVIDLSEALGTLHRYSGRSFAQQTKN